MHTLFIDYTSPAFTKFLEQGAGEWDFTPGTGSFDQEHWFSTASFKSATQAGEFARFLQEECNIPEDLLGLYEMSVTEERPLS